MYKLSSYFIFEWFGPQREREEKLQLEAANALKYGND